MKPFLFLLIASLYSSFSFAEELDKKINEACLRHAVSLVTQLKSDVVPEMDQTQSDEALKLATDTCQTYFNKTFTETPIAKEETDDEDSDWLTEKILSGDVERKAGNKRLSRKR